jgi:pimeloyl-ACP methyl ester carboxylesterase
VMLSMRLRAVRRSRLGFAGCFADLRHVDGEFHELFVAPMLRSSALAARQFALVRTLDVKLVDGLRSTHGRIRAPTLLIWGEHDPIFPPTKARAMLSQFAGGAELEVLAGGKAFVHEEQPDAFVAHAKPFLLRAFEHAAQPAHA